MASLKKGVAMSEELDKCVSCGELTIHKRTDHIDARRFYIEGAGQLCPKCYQEIYSEKNEN
jgi:hypothetical protein